MQLLNQKPYTFDRVVRMILSAVIFVGVLFLAQRLSSALIPFLIATMLAYLIEPLVGFFQKTLRVRNRAASVFLALMLIVGGISFLLIWLIPQLAAEITKVGVLVKGYVQQQDIRDVLPGDLEESIREFLKSSEIHSMLSSENVVNVFRNSVSRFWTVFSGSINFVFGLLGLLVIFLYLIFILLDYERIANGWVAIVPPKQRETVFHIFEDLKVGMNTYFRAQGLIALIVGVLLSIGFKVIGLPMGILLGLFIGMLNIVPYLQILGLVPALFFAVLKALQQGTSFGHEALMVLIVVGIVQAIQETVLNPKILGKAYGMHPAIILLSLSIWASLMGVLGMLIALPVTTVLFSYYKRFVLTASGEENQDDGESQTSAVEV